MEPVPNGVQAGVKPSVPPVFYDPDQRRWPVIRSLAFILALLAGAFLCFLVLSVLTQPVLPSVDLGARLQPEQAAHGDSVAPPPAEPSAAPTKALKKIEERQARLLQRTEHPPVRGKRPLFNRLHPQPAAQAASNEPLRAGFVVTWDPKSMACLREHHQDFDLVFPEWLNLHSDDGKLQVIDADEQAGMLAFLRAERESLSWMPLVNNFNGKEWEGEATGKLLAKSVERQKLEQDLLVSVKLNDGRGVCIDLESIPEKYYLSFELFLRELSTLFHRDSLRVAVCVPMQEPRFPYKLIAQYADLLIPMGYDEHWSSGAPGPVASQKWFTDNLTKLAIEIPKEKLLLGLGDHGYDWTDGQPAASLTYEEAVGLARASNAAWQWDDASLNPCFGYRDAQDHRHQVWLLDAVTMFNQIAAAQTFKVRGFALWRLGSEDPGMWHVWPHEAVLNADTADALHEVLFDGQVRNEGQGEVMRVTSAPTVGEREISFDPKRGLITGMRFTQYPSPYVVTHYGAATKKIVLTFDDGPDPNYTPGVLDTLKEAGVPAVFFVVGTQVQANPELLDRIIEEGHEIGNHTYSHPNIAQVPYLQLEMELNTVQRQIESRSGHRSVLFRPPFGADTEPHSEAELLLLEAVNQMGYVVVGMHIDPRDWSGAGEDEIVRTVLEQAERGDGNVILLHDSGGDRRATLRALPKIIAELKARGFQFVSLANLLNVPPEELMPALPAAQRAISTVNRMAFGLLNLASRALAFLFTLGIVLGLLRLAFISVFAWLEHRRRQSSLYDPGFAPRVAVIVPAYNEEKVVAQTIHSLLASDYKGPLEILVVDDGSKDGTYAAAKAAFEGHPHVRVFTKPNGGKSAALNFGIELTDAEIVVCLDADTLFKPDAVAKLVRHFSSPNVGAVAGNAKVGNRLNLITRWQALEYITCQNLDRRAFSYLNCITVVPGAVGAWRRDLVQSAGGFSHHTLAEDADLTMGIRRMGYRIVNEEGAIALTEAPDTIGGFVKQRFRWMFGTLQAGFRHIRALFNPRYGALGFVALPNIFIFQVFFPLISPIMDVVLLLSAIGAGVELYHHPGVWPAGSMAVLGYYLLFMLVDFAAAWFAFMLEPAEDKKLLFWLFPQRFFYRQLMYWVAIRSTLAALKGVAVGWGKLERKATVTMPMP